MSNLMRSRGNGRSSFLTREQFSKRVEFVAHALAPDELSTMLINQCLAELGWGWPDHDDKQAFTWLAFPVMPLPGVKAEPVWVDFSIIPVFGLDFFKAIPTGSAFRWVSERLLHAITDIADEKVDLTIGFGALTKNATGHGEDFWKKYPDLAKRQNLRSTHGDAGSVALILEACRRAGVGQTSRIAVIGANGAIGESLAQRLSEFYPESLMLVGRGGGQKRNTLEAMANELVPQFREVQIHQDHWQACLDHGSTVVIVATNGTRPEDALLACHLPEQALVLDVTAPPACAPSAAWQDRSILVLRAGCGQFEDTRAIPQWFGTINGQKVWDIGAGGYCVIWGCTGETIARAMFDQPGHLVGKAVPVAEVEWSAKAFREMCFGPQPPEMFGRSLTWEEVREHVSQSRPSRGRRTVSTLA